MTKNIFNLGKWWTIVWMTIGIIGNIGDMFYNNDAFWAVVISVPTLIWLFNLRLITEKEEEIEISVKS